MPPMDECPPRTRRKPLTLKKAPMDEKDDFLPKAPMHEARIREGRLEVHVVVGDSPMDEKAGSVPKAPMDEKDDSVPNAPMDEKDKSVSKPPVVENNERLFGAAKDGDIEELTRLLSCGASPDGFESKLKKTEGYTALKVAISTSHVSCAKALIRAGADVNHVDAVGFSAAHVAALHGAVDCVHVLARSGAKLDLVCGGAAFLSPIVLAAIRGHASCVTAFARLGVDVDGRCDQRRTALMSAMRGEELANGLCSCEPLPVSGVKAPPLLMWRVISSGEELANGMHTDAEGSRILREVEDQIRRALGAAPKERPCCVEMFRAAGADLGLVDSHGRTALHWARGGLAIRSRGRRVSWCHHSSSPLFGTRARIESSAARFEWRSPRHGEKEANVVCISGADPLRQAVGSRVACRGASPRGGFALCGTRGNQSSAARRSTSGEARFVATRRSVRLTAAEMRVDPARPVEAVHWQRADWARALMQAAIGVNAADYDGATPLMNAASSGWLEVRSSKRRWRWCRVRISSRRRHSAKRSRVSLLLAGARACASSARSAGTCASTSASSTATATTRCGARRPTTCATS